jgi:hypothetical protein
MTTDRRAGKKPALTTDHYPATGQWRVYRTTARWDRYVAVDPAGYILTWRFTVRGARRAIKAEKRKSTYARKPVYTEAPNA